MAITRTAIIASFAFILSIILIFSFARSTSGPPTVNLPQTPKLAAELPQNTLQNAEQNLNTGIAEDKEGYIGADQGVLLNTTETLSKQAHILPSTTQLTPTSQPPISLPSPSSLPILALLYTGASGPKKCRGTLLTAISLPKPATQHKTPVCYDLPSNARCGVFVSEKEDHCEARLFSSPGCLDTDQSYVNTVVFMPELRPVGALWRSMEVRCGIEVKEVAPIDPSVFGQVVTHEHEG